MLFQLETLSLVSDGFLVLLLSNDLFKPILNMICFFVFSVVAFMMNAYTIEFMPKWLGNAFWAYPLCTVVNCLMKLPNLHTFELQCQVVCEATKCNWHDLCEMSPECCRK